MGSRTSARWARLKLALIAATALAVLTAGGAAVVATVTTPGTASETPGEQGQQPAPSARATSGTQPLTPATGRGVPLVEPDEQHRSGVSTGWPHTSLGAVSAAVAHEQEIDLLDDSLAREQLKAVADDGRTVADGVSRVRRTREDAGLPPSGGPPSGISVTTTVQAVRTRTLDTAGDVIEIWMSLDRYAQVRDKSADEAPLKGETVRAIYTWHGGDWKRTSAKRWMKHDTSPRAYAPTSPYAYADGWREVRDG